MMTPPQAVFAAIVACVAGSATALLVARWRTLAGYVAFLATAAAAGLAGFGAAGALRGTAPAASAAGWLAAGANCQRLQVDGLTAVFLLITAAVSLPASL